MEIRVFRYQNPILINKKIPQLIIQIIIIIMYQIFRFQNAISRYEHIIKTAPSGKCVIH